ncbi:hypothetical protein [Bordetella genomosp. 8]|uniref:hypothetical protein n=1 Tax=Bordetella genomosp. 8 TaxID=1416806 RepID=UPI001E2CB8A7|nr:hypothetical protein [Bordetella genomosp. 8]
MALKKTRIVNEGTPAQSVGLTAQSGAAGAPSISPFQWISLARATWTWIMRPLWNLCFVFPTKVIRYTMSSSPPSEEAGRRQEDWDHTERRRRDEEFRRNYSRW